MQTSLLAAAAVYIVDAIALLAILIFAVRAAKKGFVECFFGFISTVLAIIVAFLFMNALMSATNGLFGLQGKEDLLLNQHVILN